MSICLLAQSLFLRLIKAINTSGEFKQEIIVCLCLCGVAICSSNEDFSCLCGGQHRSVAHLDKNSRGVPAVIQR